MNLKYRNQRNARFIATAFNKPLDRPDWYKIESASDDEADILLYDYIGWPFNEAGDFVRALSGLKQSKIIIRINSPGGDIFDANAIHNAIKSHPSKPITRVESLSASASSYISIAGSKREAYKNTMFMIHEPMCGIYGNQYEVEEMRGILSQISDIMVDMYADNTNVGKRELKEMLKAETWMSAKVAKEKGFIDTIIEAGKGAKAEYDLSVFSRVPDDLMADKEIDKRKIEKALRDVGFTQNSAKAFIARGLKADCSEIVDETKIEKLSNILKGEKR
jgi:ATP-dependent Clp protease, protease subunit